MSKIKRVFLVVLDSMGCGYEPDADKFGAVHESIFYYSKSSNERIFNKLYSPFDKIFF